MSRRKTNRNTDESIDPETSLCLCDRPGCHEQAVRLFEFSVTTYVKACGSHTPEGSAVAVYELPESQGKILEPKSEIERLCCAPESGFKPAGELDNADD